MDYLKHIWGNLYQFSGKNDYLFIILGSNLTTLLTFWGLNAFFLTVDFTGKPAFVLKFKVQEDKNVPVNPKRLKRAIKVALFNQFCIGFPLSFLVYPLQIQSGISCDPEKFPSIFQAVKDLLVIVFVEECAFYYSHRLLHYGPLYKHIHKIHHEWTAPIGVVAIYAHPVEMVVSNILPFLLGPMLLGTHVFTMWVWFAIGITATTITHSGYHLPFLRSPEFHDYHHLKFNQNYGATGLLDWVHGTDSEFRTTIQNQRHRTLWGFTPVNQQYPSPNKRT